MASKNEPSTADVIATPLDATLPSSTSAPQMLASEADVGTALRQAFRATVDEDVPDAMLDLLRRLS